MSYTSLPTSKLFQLTALTLSLALAGCGGGDGTDTIAPAPDLGVSVGTVGGTVGGADSGSFTEAGAIYISSEKTELLTGEDNTTLTIRVIDKDGGIVTDAPVKINIADAALYGLSFSSTSNQITDDKGLFTIDLVQSKTDINSQLDHESLLTVTVNTNNGVIKQTFPIIVSGTKAIDVSSTKNIVSTSDSFKVTGKILDGSGSPVSNADVTLYSNDKQAGTGKLDKDGNFSFALDASQLVALNNNYVFSIEVKGNKISQRIPDILTVASTTSSSLSFSETPDIVVDNRQKVTLNVPNAVDGETVTISTNKGSLFTSSTSTENDTLIKYTVSNKKVDFYIDSSVAGIANISAQYGEEKKETILNFVSIEASKLQLTVDRAVISVGESTQVIAKVLDEKDRPIKNAIVQFSLVNDSSRGTISTGVVYTDNNGDATVTYRAGLTPTSLNGVNIKAQVKYVKLPDGQEKPVVVGPADSFITVQTKSTFISFAFADKISTDSSQIYYFRQGSISVLNNTGQPAVNQLVTINLNPDSYFKGFFEIIKDASGSPSWNRKDVACENEDKNGNGILDSGEDFNSNGKLEPINVAAVLPDSSQEAESSKSFRTDENGRVDFSIRYPKTYANWYRAKITVNTLVDGSESQQSRVIDFPALVDDIDINIPLRPNTNSPFGTELSCSSAR